MIQKERHPETKETLTVERERREKDNTQELSKFMRTSSKETFRCQGTATRMGVEGVNFHYANEILVIIIDRAAEQRVSGF